MKPLKYEEGTWKYRLKESATCEVALPIEDVVDTPWYTLTPDGILAKVGYAWDGPSGPAIDTENALRASLFHDILYQAIKEDQITKRFRKKADKLLLRILREDGMSYLRRRIWYYSVRTGGYFYAKGG